MGTFTLKRLTLTTVFLLFGFLAIQAVDDDDLITKQITVTLDEAGTLPTRIGDSKKYKITNLKIVGDINGTDVRFIREMAGRAYDGYFTNGKLAILDLSDVKIVKGGGAYLGNVGNGLYIDKEDIIGQDFFSNCNRLTSVILPLGVTNIDNYAFELCNNLTNVEIPSSVKSIGYGVFTGCSSLTSIDIPSSVESIGNGVFTGCSSLTRVKIPLSQTIIDYRTFEGCSSLTSIVIPSNVTSIEFSAFRGCSNLASIVIPSNVTTISEYAFSGCSSLTSVIIPLSVTSIGKKAFADCTGLTSVYVSRKSPVGIDVSTFENIDKTACTLYVPQGTKDNYWLSNWGDSFDNIVEYDVTGIGQVSNGGDAKEVSRYSVDGKRLDAPAKGLNIVKYSDGSVRKITVQHN